MLLTVWFAFAKLRGMFPQQCQNPTPLLEALRACANSAEQHTFAQLAGTSRNYLYQLALCERKNPGIQTVNAIVEASKVMHVRTTGRVPKLTMEDFANMCKTE